MYFEYFENQSLCIFQPHIRIWDSVSLHTLHVIGLGDFERAVACVAFSKAVSFQSLKMRMTLISLRFSDWYGFQLLKTDINDLPIVLQDGGSLLVAVDEANEHIISVWEWDKGEKRHKITETKVSNKYM